LGEKPMKKMEKEWHAVEEQKVVIEVRSKKMLQKYKGSTVPKCSSRFE
jgi:peptidyl-tRNA hydrolase